MQGVPQQRGCNSGLSCIDLNNPAETAGLYNQFLTSGFNTPALESQASQELDAGLLLLYGTTDKSAIVALWQSDPATVPLDGSYGLSHAAQTLLALEVIRLSGGGSNAAIQAEVDNQLAYWYSREAVARCNDSIEDWLNPLEWNPDSRLDYMAVKLFVDWYLAQV